MGRFINAGSYADTGDELLGSNMFAYCGNTPVNYEQLPVSYGSSIEGNISESVVEQADKNVLLSKSGGFHLFGYEFRTSAGLNNSPYIATHFFGRIGYSSYVTYTQGQSGMLYAFAGSTSDIMSWFGTTYYAGLGINLFDIIGIEAQLEMVGIGAKVSVGRFSVGVDVNVTGGTSITFGWDTDLGNGMTRSDCFTIGVNTGCLVAACLWLYKFVVTGDTSLVPGLRPI